MNVNLLVLGSQAAGDAPVSELGTELNGEAFVQILTQVADTVTESGKLAGQTEEVIDDTKEAQDTIEPEQSDTINLGLLSALPTQVPIEVLSEKQVSFSSAPETGKVADIILVSQQTNESGDTLVDKQVDIIAPELLQKQLTEVNEKLTKTTPTVPMETVPAAQETTRVSETKTENLTISAKDTSAQKSIIDGPSVGKAADPKSETAKIAPRATSNDNGTGILLTNAQTPKLQDSTPKLEQAQHVATKIADAWKTSGGDTIRIPLALNDNATGWITVRKTHDGVHVQLPKELPAELTLAVHKHLEEALPTPVNTIQETQAKGQFFHNNEQNSSTLWAGADEFSETRRDPAQHQNPQTGEPRTSPSSFAMDSNKPSYTQEKSLGLDLKV